MFQCQLSFYVFDWDGTSSLNDDFLGSAHYKMSEVSNSKGLGYTYKIKYELLLNISLLLKVLSSDA